MPEPQTHMYQPDEFSSPVEERHIDYILEEEFLVDPKFLGFFIEQARSSATDKGRIVGSEQGNGCSAVRSVTTEEGETDLLVKYGAQNGNPGIAILIENKIRAGFQPDQAARYRLRGEAGKGRSWSNYWTCLVSHDKYVVDKGDFDAVVTLQALRDYFAQGKDARSQFRFGILKQTIHKFETSGVQKIDPGMTRFREMYATACANSLQNGRWECDKKRDAWWDDSWFNFRRTNWPKGVKVVHQARTGLMKLVLPIRDETLSQRLVEQCASWDPHISEPRIVVIPFGKTGSAFQITVPVVRAFSIAAQPVLFEKFFGALESLADFYERCSDLLPEALRISAGHDDAWSDGIRR